MVSRFRSIVFVAATLAGVAGLSAVASAGPVSLKVEPDASAIVMPVQGDGRWGRRSDSPGGYAGECAPGTECWNYRNYRYDDFYWGHRQYREHRRQARQHRRHLRQYRGYTDRYVPQYRRSDRYFFVDPQYR
jgi:hypothetical protein